VEKWIAAPVVVVSGGVAVVTSVEKKNNTITGADFHRATVATAPREKLITGRRPVKNWIRRTIASLFLCRKLHLFVGKSTKTAATRAALFDSNAHLLLGRGEE